MKKMRLNHIRKKNNVTQANYVQTDFTKHEPIIQLLKLCGAKKKGRDDIGL